MIPAVTIHSSKVDLPISSIMLTMPQSVSSLFGDLDVEAVTDAPIGATMTWYGIGGATVSDRHANFIVTKPGATANDVLKLLTEVRRRVYEHAGIELKEEIAIWRRGAAE